MKWMSMIVIMTVTALCISACGDIGENQGDVGELTMTLATISPLGVEYRLRNALFQIDGPEPTLVDSEDTPADQARISVPLASGDYDVTLGGMWYLEHSADGQPFTPIDAILISPNPASVRVIADQVAFVTFTFEVDEGDINFGPGTLSIGIDVNENGGAGDGCDPNWTDPNGQLECPEGAPVSCDRATQCWPTVAECEASGQCNNGGAGGAAGTAGVGGFAGVGGGGGGTGGSFVDECDMLGMGGMGGAAGGVTPTLCNEGAPQEKVVSVGCANGVTTAQSPLPYLLSVQVTSPIVRCEEFDATLSGTGFFPEFFLDAAQGVVCGGVEVAELVDFVSTVQVRSGATGADVPLGIDVTTLDPGATRFCNFPTDQTCTADDQCTGGTCEAPVLLQALPVQDGIPGSEGGCTADTSTCPTAGAPPDCDCSPCAALDTAPDGPKQKQCVSNGFCQDGSLVIDMESAVGNYTARFSGDILWGWADKGVPDLLLCPDPAGCVFPDVFHVDGCYDLPPASFSNPTAPIGIRVQAGTLAIPIQCAMAEDGGKCEGVGSCSETRTTSCTTNDDCPGIESCAGLGCLCDDPEDVDGACASADCVGGETCMGVGEDDDVVCPTRDASLIACPIN